MNSRIYRYIPYIHTDTFVVAITRGIEFVSLSFVESRTHHECRTGGAPLDASPLALAVGCLTCWLALHPAPLFPSLVSEQFRSSLPLLFLLHIFLLILSRSFLPASLPSSFSTYYRTQASFWGTSGKNGGRDKKAFLTNYALRSSQF